MAIRPLGTKVYLVKYKEEDQKKSFLVLPDDNKFKDMGRVVSFGADCKQVFQAGEIVIYQQYSARSVLGDDEHLIVDEKDILAIYE